ncbi:MAG TPA: hypothetical protein VGS80_24385, partial [Ktedonobacterales bacterium]|nr:hypothetical protein [Ktedonobacterales bacterium]
EQAKRPGPFAAVALNGADVFCLAAWALGRSRAGSPSRPPEGGPASPDGYGRTCQVVNEQPAMQAHPALPS